MRRTPGLAARARLGMTLGALSGALLAASIPCAALAVPGRLDATFGAGGKVTTDFVGSDQGQAVAVQRDGKMVVAGASDVAGAADFALARYNGNGSLDPRFGSGARVTTDFGGSELG